MLDNKKKRIEKLKFIKKLDLYKCFLSYINNIDQTVKMLDQECINFDKDFNITKENADIKYKMNIVDTGFPDHFDIFCIVEYDIDTIKFAHIKYKSFNKIKNWIIL